MTLHNPYFRTYVEREEETAKVTLEKFKEEFDLYERCYELYLETLDRVRKLKRKGVVSRLAILLIQPRIIQSLQSIRLLVSKGHYYDSEIVARSLWESLGLCAYISSDEEEARRWLTGKPIRVKSIHLFEHINRLLRYEKYDTEIRQVYGNLCNYVHTNVKAVAKSLVFPTQKVKRAREFYLPLVPQFDEKKVTGISANPLLATLVMEEIFKKELKLDRKKRRKSDKLVRLFLRTYKES